MKVRHAREGDLWPCELCRRPASRWHEVDGCSIALCRSCNHNTVAIEPGDHHVDDIYTDAYFTGGGAGYNDYTAEAAYLRRQGRRYGELLRDYGVRRGLDVGAAAGFFLAGLADVDIAGVGIEPNERMVRFGAATGLDMRCGTAENTALNEPFDVVLMIQVIAHFFDLHAALAKLAAVTRPGGFWLIETWDRSSWTARLFGKRWHEYSPPSVLRMFSFESLVRLAADYGFVLVASGRPSKKITVAHARSLLTHKAKHSRAMRWLARAAAVLPADAAIPYPLDDARWLLFRKSPA